MSFRAECPNCGRSVRVAEKMSGRLVRCPYCDGLISATGSRSEDGFADKPRRRVHIRRNQSMTALILGIIALVLGVPSLAVSWLPFLCIVSLIFAGIGLLIGLVGVVFGAAYERSGLGLAIAGGSVNLLALLVALIVTIASADLADSPAKLAEPSPGPTLPDWGQVFDPDGDCTISPQATSLQITVPPTAHDLSAELGKINAPRVLQQVEGDFRVQVRVSGVIHPTAAGSVPGRLSFQAAGLLLWSDPQNYLRFEHSAVNRDGRILSFASLELRATGQPTQAHSLDMAEEDFYLRLERRGNRLLAAASRDGQHWTPLPPWNVAFPPKVRVGVAAVNAAAEPLTVRFEQLRLER